MIKQFRYKKAALFYMHTQKAGVRAWSLTTPPRKDLIALSETETKKTNGRHDGQGVSQASAATGHSLEMSLRHFICKRENKSRSSVTPTCRTPVFRHHTQGTSQAGIPLCQVPSSA